jgi:hypothetical protein
MVDNVNSVPTAVTSAGLDYDYPNTPPVATIVLVNIPADPDHQNVGLNQAAYDTFIDAQIAATEDPSTPGGAAWILGTDQVLYDPEYNLKALIDYDTATRLYNYGRITADNGRQWYVFYTPVFLNRNVTRFLADIDEFPSFSWGLGYSVIERGHIAVAASQDDTYGSEYLTAPEPVDAPPVRGVLEAGLLGSAPDSWTVLVVSANDLRGSGVTPNFFELNRLNDQISTAANLGSAATIDSAGEVQTTIPTSTYPWSTGSPPTPPSGTPENGFVPDDLLTLLATGAGPNPPMAELNTALAWAQVVASFPGATISPTIGGSPASASAYWSRALDTAIHTDPSLYGITDPDLSPIGESKHGLGIRINVEGVSPSDMTAFGFSEFNSYTYTFEGPYSWDEPTPGTLEVFAAASAPSPVSTIDGVAAGGGCYLFTQSGWATYENIMQGAPWVTAGIVAVRLVPSWALSGGNAVEYAENIPALDPTDPMWDAAAAIPVYRANVFSATASPTVLADWRDSAMTAVGVDSIWRKLLTSQFTDLLVGNGDSMTSFHPDQWGTSGIAFEAVTGAAHGDASIRLIPVGYNDLGAQMGIDSPVGGVAGITQEGLGIATANTAQADIGPYMAAYTNNESWQVQFRQRELAQNLGLTNVQLSLGAAAVATALGAATGAVNGSTGAALAPTKDGEKVPLGGGALAAGLAGGAAAGFSSLINTSIQASNTIQLLDISTDGSFDIGALQLGISGLGSYYTYQAWVQSLDAVPGSGSPEMLASAWRAIMAQAFQVIVAMPSAERVKRLLSEWKRYGYMIGQAFDPGQLNVMSHFSYWKTQGALITGSTPQEKRSTIAQAFDRGVTVWDVIAEIGTDVTADNTPLSGISY